VTVSLFPDTLDLEIEVELPRGSNSPISIIPETVDFGIGGPSVLVVSSVSTLPPPASRARKLGDRGPRSERRLLYNAHG
jgi:hypothetical protein